jgi:hypothetical protein
MHPVHGSIPMSAPPSPAETTSSARYGHVSRPAASYVDGPGLLEAGLRRSVRPRFR